jgi:rubrerythrin
MIYCFNAAEVFQLALEIKENGRAFYEQAQNKIQDPDIKKQFAVLAREEQAHMDKIMALKAESPWGSGPSTPDPENEMEVYVKATADQHVYKTCGALSVRLDTIQDVSDVLKLALQFEKDSVIFFMSMQEAICEGKDREVIDILLKEELVRVKQLSMQIQRMGYCRL